MIQCECGWLTSDIDFDDEGLGIGIEDGKDALRLLGVRTVGLGTRLSPGQGQRLERDALTFEKMTKGNFLATASAGIGLLSLNFADRL